MLISLVLTLLLMAALVNVFDLMGDSLRSGRATIALSENLRRTADLLQRDLDGLTVQAMPWVDEGSASGYLEIIERRSNDATSFTRPTHIHADLGNVLGDIDDVLQFTTRSAEQPFRGQLSGEVVQQSDGKLLWNRLIDQRGVRSKLTQIESPVAEVRWWVDFTDQNRNGDRDLGEPYILMRRVMLVRPDIQLAGFGGPAIQIQEIEDISLANPTPELRTRTASLADLSLRQYRYAHRVGGTSRGFAQFMTSFPFPPASRPQLRGTEVRERDRPVEEFAVLGDVLSFDVRVYDPLAPLDVSGPVALAPGDPGYRVPDSPTARGAFVDLNYARDGSSVLDGASTFSGPSHPKSKLVSLPFGGPADVYDTWPNFYERDGYDQDGDGLIDEGTNGIDDDNTNGVDDPGERETSPPYPAPLRGIEVRIRVMDHQTRQVRQVSVVADFTRE